MKTILKMTLLSVFVCGQISRADDAVTLKTHNPSQKEALIKMESLIPKPAPASKIVLPNPTTSFQINMATGGNSGGGGGKGLVCRNSNGEIQSVELLDLWEARAIYQRKMAYSKLTLDQQIEKGIQNLKTVFYSWPNPAIKPTPAPDYSWVEGRLRGEANFLKDTRNLIPIKDGKLKLSDDSFEFILPPENSNCKVEQIILYFDYMGADTVYFDQKIFDHMDDTNKAALILHESLYKLLRRESSELNSLRTRRSIGLAMSGSRIPSLREFVDSHAHMECRNNSNRKENLNVFFLVDALSQDHDGTAAIAFVPVVINGVDIIGQVIIGGVSSYNGFNFTSINDLLKPGALFHGVEINNSNIDFDLRIEYKYELSAQGPQITLMNYSTANGHSSAEPIVLSCKMAQ